MDLESMGLALFSHWYGLPLQKEFDLEEMQMDIENIKKGF